MLQFGHCFDRQFYLPNHLRRFYDRRFHRIALNDMPKHLFQGGNLVAA